MALDAVLINYIKADPLPNLNASQIADFVS